MKKVMILGLALLAFAAFISLPNAAYACGGDKASATKSASADKTDAKLASSKVKEAGSSCSASAAKSASADNAVEAKYAVANMSVKGMTCTGCENSLTTALKSVNGVVDVEKVCYKTGTAVVKYDPSKCTEANLTRTVADKGYQAEIIPAVATTVNATGAVCPVTGKTCSDADKAACAAKQANAEKTKASGTY